MSLINPAILYGLGLAAIPIILHFLLRSKPKKLLFPALRLIQIRRRQNVRRMRLRHIWLLLLRMAVILLLVLALARPSLPAADYSLTWTETLVLMGIAAAALGSYWAVMAMWKRRRLPQHVINSRRTLLRGGTGLAALLLALLLVAWPYQRRIGAEMTAPVPPAAENLPVSAVFLFDTSLSMDYRQKGETRLDRAKSIALEHLSTLPQRSRVAIAESSSTAPIPFQAESSGTISRIKSVQIQPVSHALNDRLRAAIGLQEEDRRRTLAAQGAVPREDRQDRYLREIYVFTDMSASAWDLDAAQYLLEDMERLPWISVYLIDVGAPEPMNLSIRTLELSKQRLSMGDQLIVTATVAGTGVEAADRLLELYVQNESGQLIKQGQSTLQIDGRSAASVPFPISGLTGPLRRGEVRLISSDPLAIDDVRYFTVEITPPPEVLIVAPHNDAADYLVAALAPPAQVRAGRARYRCTVRSPRELAGADLSAYDVVCLSSVEQLPEPTWSALVDYVEAGGGLAVFLGTTAVETAVSYNTRAAQTILPGELIAHVGFNPPEVLDLSNLAHPILQKFNDYESGTGELTRVDVRRSWKVEPSDQANVIAAYTGPMQIPALLERVHGDGRTVLLTTAVDMQGFSDLPLARWWFLVFLDQMMQYLAQQTDNVLNYVAGEDVFVRLDPEHPLESYLLATPGLKQLPGDVPPGRSLIALPADQVREIGQYGFVSPDPDSDFKTGFSVNAPPSESDLTKLQESDLDSLFGKKRYSVADTMEGLTRNVADARIGQEMFSAVLMFVILVFCGEHLVANRFYAADQADAEWSPSGAAKT